MTHLSVKIRPVDAAALLELAGVSLSPTSPLAPWLVDLDPLSTSESQMESAGLIIREDTGPRTNATLALALSTLAQPQELFEIHSVTSDREATLTVATVAGHRVGLIGQKGGSDRMEILFPLGRSDLLASIRQSFDAADSDTLELDLLIPATGHFLIGVMARLGVAQSHSVSEIIESTRNDLGDLALAASLAGLDPESADALHSDPTRVAVELGRLLATGAVSMDADTYGLTPDLRTLLSEPAVATVHATRFDSTTGQRSTITGVRLGPRIAMIQTHIHDDVPSTRLRCVTGRQLGDSIGALLFSESELRSLPA